MRRIALFAVGVGLLAPLLVSAPAQAQATRTWVSGVGDDVNPCSRTAPCKTFPGAISKTAASGEINCLDSAGFGAVTITKAISIICEGVTGGILSSLTTGVIVNAGPNDKVTLKGLDINGVGNGVNGIRFIAGGGLTVEDTTIQGTTGFGIQFAPAVSSSFTVTRVTAIGNALGGIQVRPTGGTTTSVINQFVAYKNGAGIVLDGAGGGVMNTAIRDSVLNNNTGAGISLATGGTAIGAMVTRTAIVANATGISAGANTFPRVGQLEVTANATAFSGTVLSFGTNQVIGNGAGETLTLLSPALK